MAKRKKRRSEKIAAWKKILWTFWLLFSVSGTVLFSFGLLAIFNSDGTWYPVIIGASIIFVGVLTGKFTTETAFAMKGRR